jgi:hypothetical protein
MARQIGFHLYSIQVREKYGKTYETLSSLRGKQDFLSLLNGGMKTTLYSQKDDESDERITCLKRVDLSARNLTGLMEAGHYGETANIVHSKTGRTVHQQATEEASLLPFFFRIVIPQGKDRGLLILQRDNRLRGKQILKSVVDPILSKFDESLKCEMEPIMNRETFEKMVGEGQIQQIKFIKMSIPQDFADEYDKGRDEERGTMELTVKARRGRGLPMKKRLTDWMTSDKGVKDLFKVPGLDFEYDRVKADLRIGRNKRTVDFGKKMSNPIIDLTDEVTMRRGHQPRSSQVYESP